MKASRLPVLGGYEFSFQLSIVGTAIWHLSASLIPVILTLYTAPHKLHGVTILLICADPVRLEQRRAALQSADFRIVSARSVNEGWYRSDFFDISAVVIDDELGNEIAASAFRQRFITCTFQCDAAPDLLVMELAKILRGGSELVH